ncbi:MAG: RHS repeat-associated core domain-containing protein [Halioglobus sp.]
MNHLSLSLASTTLALMASFQTIALERTWNYQYNSNGQVTAIHGPRSDVDDRSNYTYDDAGRRTSVENALGHVIYMSNHNQRGQPQLLIDINGVETRLSYHPRGWLVNRTVVSPSGNSAEDSTVHYSYDNNGLLVATTLADGTRLTNEYDPAHRLVAVSNNQGDRIEYLMDAAGNVIVDQTYNSSANLTRSSQKTYDELNRLINITGASGQVTSFSYDQNGNRSSETDGNGNLTIQLTDSLNRKSGSNGAYSHNTQYVHDSRHNLTAVTDPKGLSTRYSYNEHNELTLLESPDTGATRYAYDNAGNRTTMTDANGVTVTTAYDALNRPTHIGYPNPELDIHYGYDQGHLGKGRLTSIRDSSGTTFLEYDHRGNLIHQTLEADGNIFSIAYTYDLANKITAMTYPSGRIIQYSYNSIGRLSSIQNSDKEGVRTIASNLEYLPYGPLTDMNYGNGIQMKATFDKDYRVQSLEHANTLDRNYLYDNANNILSIEDRRNPLLHQAFAYDALNRIGAASGNYGNLSYAYDAIGNRLTYSDAINSDSYEYDSTSNRLLSKNKWNYEYDNNGNMIAKIDSESSEADGFYYLYDQHNRLKQARHHITDEGIQRETVLATYTYNAKGQRSKKETAKEIVHYIYDNENRLLTEISDTGVTLREYIYLNDNPIAVAQAVFTEYPAEAGPEIVLDDTDMYASTTGNWDRVRKKGAYGDYYQRSEDGGGHFRWNLKDINPSDYEVYAWWPKVRKNNRNALFSIFHSGQVSTSVQDQGRQGKKWVYLGTYKFSGDGEEYLTLSDEGGKTAADGIRLVEILQPPPSISTELFYIHADHLGTPQSLTDTSRNIVWNANYQPFGEAEVDIATIVSNLRFPGQYYDQETGLHQNYFRDYDPALGRYIQSDPIGLSGGINPYTYAYLNSLINTDPFGLEVKVNARDVIGTAGFGAHTATTVTTGDGKSVTYASYKIGNKNRVVKNAASDHGPNRLPITDSVVIPPPVGMTQNQWDNAVIQAGERLLLMPPQDYAIFPGSSGSKSNCHVTTNRLLNNAGGSLVRGFNPPGLNPGL